MQEAEDHGDVGVGPCRGHDVQVGVTDKGESTFWQLYQRGQAAKTERSKSCFEFPLRLLEELLPALLLSLVDQPNELVDD